MERNIGVVCAPVVYYGGYVCETIIEFLVDIIDLTCCRTDVR
jgi:hypothetical protein